MKEKWAKVDKINEKMTNLIKNNSKAHEKLKTPTNCFITFDREDGPDLAEHYNHFIKDPDFNQY